MNRSTLAGLSVTNKIIIINVAVFIAASIILMFNPDFMNYLALTPLDIIHGKMLWTLFTSVFMHASIIHLFVNMLSLFFIGNFVEKIIGRKRFLWFYLAAGLIAGLFFAMISGFFGYGFLGKIFGDPAIPGVGASGAIFGLVGLLAVLVPYSKVYLIAGPLVAIISESVVSIFVPSNSALLNIISILVTIYIFVSLFAMFSFNPRTSRIALPIEMPFWILPIVAIVPLVAIGIFVPLPIGNMAHFGGLLAGLAYGMWLRIKYQRKVKMLSYYVTR
jgi:membrane associated rhomboid family serine protease